MAINKKLIHFNNFSTFNSKKLSANVENTKYTIGVDGAVQTGAPDILYQSICWIKDTKQQWTHGQLYDGSKSDTTLNETDPVFSASPAANITEEQIRTWDDAHGFVQVFDEDISKLYTALNGKQDAISDLATIRDGASKGATALQSIPSEYVTETELNAALSNKMDKVTLAKVATSGSYNDLTNKPTIPASITESTVSGWGFTKNTGTITGVSANGTSVATSGVANIPAATTSKYGVTKLSSATNSTSTTLAATASAVKAAYDLANSYKGTVTGVKINGTTKNPSSGVVDLGTVITAHQDISGKQDKLVSGTNIKTINGTSILGSGDIVISGGSSSGGSGAYAEVNHGTSDTTFTLTPNTFHVWEEVVSLTLDFGSETSGVANEYLFQFTSGATATTLTLPGDLKWANDAPPTIAENMIYQVSILKGLASVLEFRNAPELIENHITYSEGDMMTGGTITFEYPTASELTFTMLNYRGGELVVPQGSTSVIVDWFEPSPPVIKSISPIEDSTYKYIL